MAGGQITYEFGYCPYDYKPFCCAATVGPLASGWGFIYAYTAVVRLLLVSRLAVAFPLKNTSQPTEESGPKAVRQGQGKTES